MFLSLLGGDREILRNWRPITLLNIDYTLISKCFSECLNSVLPNSMHTDQKAIQDSIKYVDENNHEGVVVFLDQTKAFDRVEWYWIDKCLEKFNFGDNFRKWTHMMLKGSKTAIKTNVFFPNISKCLGRLNKAVHLHLNLYNSSRGNGASIRSDPNIKGINLPLHDNVFRESRLS